MSFTIDVGFPGGKKVDAHYNGFTVQTDQDVEFGGEGSAPTPFEMFFISLATCSGYYALQFCQSRNLNTDGLKVSLVTEKNMEKKLHEKINVSLTLPKDFPEKYRGAIIRAVELCTVKRHVQAELIFNVQVQN